MFTEKKAENIAMYKYDANISHDILLFTHSFA